MKEMNETQTEKLFSVSAEFMRLVPKVELDIPNPKILRVNEPRDMLFRERIASHYVQSFKVGDYAFADGCLATDPHFRNQITGVIVWKNPLKDVPIGQRGLIMMSDEKYLEWSNKDYYFGCTDLENGFANTYKLLDAAKKQNIILPATQYCASYCQNGVQAGEGFQFAIEQLRAICKNKRKVNASLAKIKAKSFADWYCSSTEYSNHGTWCLLPRNSKVDWGKKDNCYRIRCICAF